MPNIPNSQPPVIPPFPTTNGDKVDLEDYLKKIYNFAVENTEKNIFWYSSRVNLINGMHNVYAF